MARPIEFDSWKYVQPVMWKLDPDEALYAVYENGRSYGGPYIALTDKRVILEHWEYLYKDILYVENYGEEVMFTLQTLELAAQLIFLGNSQARQAYRIIWSLRGR